MSKFVELHSIRRWTEREGSKHWLTVSTCEWVFGSSHLSINYCKLSWILYSWKDLKQPKTRWSQKCRLEGIRSEAYFQYCLSQRRYYTLRDCLGRTTAQPHKGREDLGRNICITSRTWHSFFRNIRWGIDKCTRLLLMTQHNYSQQFF